jgi:uncharacterized protein YgiM (DUF1202 family)
MVRRRFHPLIAFAAVIAAAGSVTAAGLTFTAHTVSRTVAELPEVKTRGLPSYVVRLPEAKAADLDVSKTVEVKPKTQVPVMVPDVPVAQATATMPAAPAAAEPEATLVAEVTPLSDETVEEPAGGGSLYVVKSDVFVRSGPSKSYGRVGTVTGGTQVNVTGEDGGWLKVSFAGGSGWVYQRYLAPARSEEVAEADTGSAPF